MGTQFSGLVAILQGMEGPSARIEHALPALLGGRTLALAESLTGGALAQRVVSVAGSSAYFLGGIVAYSNEAKRKLLDVPESVLRTKGAVSEETALYMARGARRAFGADVAVSTTGIAGPTGATETKPVGLVYVALVAPETEVCTRNQFEGDRLEIMEQSVQKGLQLLRDYLSGAGHIGPEGRELRE